MIDGYRASIGVEATSSRVRAPRSISLVTRWLIAGATPSRNGSALSSSENARSTGSGGSDSDEITFWNGFTGGDGAFLVHPEAQAHGLAAGRAEWLRRPAGSVPACPICNDTRWKSVITNGHEAVVRCDCWRANGDTIGA